MRSAQCVREPPGWFRQLRPPKDPGGNGEGKRTKLWVLVPGRDTWTNHVICSPALRRGHGAMRGNGADANKPWQCGLCSPALFAELIDPISTALKERVAEGQLVHTGTSWVCFGVIKSVLRSGLTSLVLFPILFIPLSYVFCIIFIMNLHFLSLLLAALANGNYTEYLKSYQKGLTKSLNVSSHNLTTVLSFAYKVPAQYVPWHASASTHLLSCNPYLETVSSSGQHRKHPLPKAAPLPARSGK